MSSLLTLVSAFLLFNLAQSIRLAPGPISYDCIDCICQAHRNCTDPPCEAGKGCGYFKFTIKDRTLCRETKENWEKCYYSAGCSSSCMRVYAAIYSFWCGGNECHYVDRLLNGGRAGCKAFSTLPYGYMVNMVETCQLKNQGRGDFMTNFV